MCRVCVDCYYIGIYNNNENWGFLSTTFPNRTVNWEDPNPEFDDHFKQFLDSSMVEMFLVNQHHNHSHRKLITMPLGIPQPVHLPKMLLDAMLTSAHDNIHKEWLLFGAMSDWGTRM